MSSSRELVLIAGNTTTLLSAHNKLTLVSTMFTYKTDEHF